MKTSAILAAAILCLPLFTVPVHGSGIYKWIDDQGVIHYADQPSVEYSSQGLSRNQLPYLHIEQPPDSIPAFKPRSRPKQRQSRKAAPAVDCDRFRGEIGRLEATLRKGYSEPTGSRLHERKRHWTSQLQKHCY